MPSAIGWAHRMSRCRLASLIPWRDWHAADMVSALTRSSRDPGPRAVRIAEAIAFDRTGAAVVRDVRRGFHEPHPLDERLVVVRLVRTDGDPRRPVLQPLHRQIAESHQVVGGDRER